ncbi:MAG: HD domain-containing protein [Clostridia bacterium]|nr:HD domain-containing protein [Clostridia bacterium]
MTGKIVTAMTNYYKGDVKRINHFMKVYAFAKAIGEEEGLDSKTQNILEIAAIVHDIGIKPSEEKYGSSAGKYQETEGPGETERLLTDLGVDKDTIERVCFLVGHHHTYKNIEGMDYQILVEADFIVNIYEDNESRAAVERVYESIFKTMTGKKYMKDMYLN